MTLATPDTKTIEQVIINGDLGTLSPDQRMSYYDAVCSSLGLNPLTKPFLYIRLNNKLVLYATRDCTDQLRNLHGISIEITSRELVQDVYVVTARANKGERSDESIGAVSVVGLKGEALANAFMKAETKSKRRVTLSINGLGMLDETEVSTIPGAKIVDVNTATGEISGAAQDAPERPVAAVQAPTRPKPPTRPQRPNPKSSEGKLDQLNQARLDSDGTEIYTGEDVVNYICTNYAERGPRDLVDSELDEVIEALIAGRVQLSVQPAPEPVQETVQNAMAI